MDQQPIQAAEAVVNSMPLAPTAATAPHSLSLIDMFLNADWIIQLIMLSLIAASIWTWTIIFRKTMKLRQLSAAADQFEETFWSGGALDDLYDRIHNRPQDPLSSVFCAAMKEWRRSVSKGGLKGKESRGTLQQRIERVMHLTINREMEDLERYIGFLASTGSTAPFVGVFGTVLGIMNSFRNIADNQNTNLAVVAPGIAEALFATAIGLIAAIPAMLAYNKISSDLNRYANRLEAFASEFSSIISRQLEEEAA